MPSQTVEQLSHICNAESVALVGASDKEGSFGRLFLEGLRDAGCRKIYPVNPKRDEILGIKAYPSISAVPDQIDLAILLTPTGVVLDLVKECVANKVRGAIVFASGFGELGAEGKELEREIGRIGREGGTRVIGPNCIGLFNPRSGVITYPQVLMKGVPKEPGSVGGFSQSGSFVDYLVWFLAEKGLRFSTIVSCGNECDLAAEDYLEYFGQDEQTRTIVAYMEGVKDGRRFFEVAREVGRKKPIILWKGGMSEQGARAAASHTGALAGSANIWNAMFKQTGIINVTSVAEVVDCAVAFQYLPLPKGPRVAVIGGQGGTGVGTADNCYALGLELPAPVREHGRPSARGAPAGRHVARQPHRHRRGLAARPEPVREDHRDRRRGRGHRHDPRHLDARPGLPRARGRGRQGHRQAVGGLRVRAARVRAGDLQVPQRARRGGVSGSQAGRLRARAHGRVRQVP